MISDEPLQKSTAATASLPRHRRTTAPPRPSRAVGDLPRSEEPPAPAVPRAPEPAPARQGLRRTRPPRLRGSFLVVLAVVVLSPLAAPLAAWWSAAPAGPAGWLRHGALALGAGLLGALAWRVRLYRTLTSVPFAVAVLAALLVATVLGTLVLQNGAPEEYAARYGSLAPVLLWVGADDLFHAPWFDGLLALLALSLLLTGTRRAVWRLPMLGHVLCHLGVVVVLAGGLVGKLVGVRGLVELHEGQTASEAWLTANGVATGERAPLGFALRLDDFEIERYAPEYRLALYAREGDSFRRSATWGLEDAGEWTTLAADFAFRLRAVHRDYEPRVELVAAPDGPPGLGVRAAAGEEHALLAGAAGRDELRLADGTLLRLVASAPGPRALAERAARRPARHRLAWRDPEKGEPRTLAVRPGETHALAAGLAVRVERFLPDFVWDSATRSAATRSEEPANPALWVVVERAGEPGVGSWLFADMPSYRDAHGAGASALELTYAFEPPLAPEPRELLVVAGERRAWLLEEGEVRERLALAGDGALPGAPGTTYRLLDAAALRHTPASRSQEWRNPVAELEVRSAGTLATRLVAASHGDPLWLPGGRQVLVLEQKPDDVKAYRSRVTVLAEGEPARAATIEVNTPLRVGGAWVYQTNYREEDPTYSGLQVVRDPGLPLVFLGFVMLSLGVVFVSYVRPRLLTGGAS